MAVAVPMAWAVSRTDMPGKGLIRTLTLGAFIMPPYLGAIGWILLAGPNAGWLNRAYRAMTGAAAGPFNIFTLPGPRARHRALRFPLPVRVRSAALEMVSSEMEDAASILGAGTCGARRCAITLPLVLPAILGGFIIIFLEAIALFGSPAMIAIPARYQRRHHADAGVLRAIRCAWRWRRPHALLAAHRDGRARGRSSCCSARSGHVTMTGKGGERRLVRLGAWRWALFGFCALVCALSVLLPLAVLAQAAFAKAGARPRARQPDARQSPLRPVRAAGDRAVDGQHVRIRGLRPRRSRSDSGWRSPTSCSAG